MVWGGAIGRTETNRPQRFGLAFRQPARIRAVQSPRQSPGPSFHFLLGLAVNPSEEFPHGNTEDCLVSQRRFQCRYAAAALMPANLRAALRSQEKRDFVLEKAGSPAVHLQIIAERVRWHDDKERKNKKERCV